MEPCRSAKAEEVRGGRHESWCIVSCWTLSTEHESTAPPSQWHIDIFGLQPAGPDITHTHTHARMHMQGSVLCPDFDGELLGGGGQSTGHGSQTHRVQPTVCPFQEETYQEHES